MAVSAAERVRRRRAKLRAAGLRPVQLWLPDTAAPGFAQACRRQSQAILAAECPASRAKDGAWEAAAAETAREAR